MNAALPPGYHPGILSAPDLLCHLSDPRSDQFHVTRANPLCRDDSPVIIEQTPSGSDEASTCDFDQDSGILNGSDSISSGSDSGFYHNGAGECSCGGRVGNRVTVINDRHQSKTRYSSVCSRCSEQSGSDKDSTSAESVIVVKKVRSSGREKSQPRHRN